MITKLKDKFFEEIVFFISLFLAVFTGIFAKFHFEAIDLNVIVTLTVLMMITLAFEKYGVLDAMAVKVLNRADSEKKTALFMVALTAVLGMFITNDVALITVVPVSITLSRKAGFDPFKLIVLEAVAANIGSSLTPFGNPQNLYLYHKYAYDIASFMSVVLPFVILGLLLLIVPISFLPRHRFTKMHLKAEITSPKWVVIYGTLFVCAVVLIVFRWNLFYVLLITAVIIVIKDRELFKSLDFFLLGTFVCFFVFVDHMNQFEWIKNTITAFLSSDQRVFITSVVLSQGMSNVPTAILLSAFVGNPNALLLGVSVGGLGTLVASLANLIAFKFYAKMYPTTQYHKYFLKVNFVMLMLCGMAFFVWVS